MSQNITALVTSLDLSSAKTLELQNSLENNSNAASVLTAQSPSAELAIRLALFVLSGFFGLLIESDRADIAALDGYWSTACAESPSFVVLPRSSHEVSLVFKLINYLNLTFAVRSGGHSPNPGWASTNEPGLVLDLRNLNRTTVSDDKQVVSLGPGAVWGNVYEALEPHKVSVIGGRLPSIGVGGLILGGGFFHFTGQYGLAADNVKSFEIVLGDGRITNVNAEDKADLFWALKGGGANFGVVIRFDLYSIPVHNIWYQLGTYALDQVEHIFDAFADWQNTCTDVKATVALVVNLEAVSLGLIYSESTPEAGIPSCFAPFKDIPATTYEAQPTNGTVLSLTQTFAAAFENGPTELNRHDYRGVSSKIDAQLYKDVYRFWKKKADAVHAATNATQTFVLQPVSANMVQAGREKGGNCLGLQLENALWWTTLIDWERAEDDAKVREVAIETTAKWEELSGQRGLEDPYLYMNDAARDQNPLVSYGKENLVRLKEISRKYDPSQVFQRLQNDGFLISKA